MLIVTIYSEEAVQKVIITFNVEPFRIDYLFRDLIFSSLGG